MRCVAVRHRAACCAFFDAYRKFVDNICDGRRAVAKKAEKSAEFRVWDKVPEEVHLFLDISEVPYNTLRYTESRFHANQHLDPFNSSVST